MCERTWLVQYGNSPKLATERMYVYALVGENRLLKHVPPVPIAP